MAQFLVLLAILSSLFHFLSSSFMYILTGAENKKQRIKNWKKLLTSKYEIYNSKGSFVDDLKKSILQENICVHYNFSCFSR